MKKLIFLLFPLLCSNCFDQGDCLDYSTNICKVNFINTTDKSARTVVLDSIVADGVNLTRYKGTSQSSVQLPLNSATNTATILFYYEGKTSSVVLTYTTNETVLSPRCGARTYFNNLAVELSGFANTRVLTTKLLSNSNVNLQIYL